VTAGKIAERLAAMRISGTHYTHGFFVNSGLNDQGCGYDCRLVGYAQQGWLAQQLKLMPTALYLVTQNDRTPFCWVDSSLVCWTTANQYMTDKGSIPPIFRNLFSPDECLWYLFHDSGYLQHGLYYLDAGNYQWTFHDQSRAWVDSSLRAGYLCQWPNREARANTIYRAVRLGGWAPWGNREDQQARWRLQALQAGYTVNPEGLLITPRKVL
jgi:hypothetical protein